MNRHISEQYDLELGGIRDQLMEMGGLVEQQVKDACLAYFTHDLPRAEDVRVNEKRLNRMELRLDDQCVGIIARRQPAAGDLRNIIGVMKAITDLERIGDEANRIAKMAIKVGGMEIPAHQYGNLRAMHNQVNEMLTDTLDAFARVNEEVAQQVIRADDAVDDAYDAIVAQCTRRMQEDTANIAHQLSTIWVARSLERIGDHAKNMAEYVIFQVLGKDVRHPSSMKT
ncbi:MAG: phosphate signaling complex protein PhoU [bacterium]